MPRPAPPPVGVPAPRAPPSRCNVAVVSHAQYVLTVTAAPASRVKVALSKESGLVTLTFDLLTLQVCDMGYLCANFSLPRPLCSRVRPDERDRQTDRQTDRHTDVRRHTKGATENAGVENAIRAKLQRWKMQEWKKREQIAGVENAGVSHMERQPDIILRQP